MSPDTQTQNTSTLNEALLEQWMADLGAYVLAMPVKPLFWVARLVLFGLSVFGMFACLMALVLMHTSAEADIIQAYGAPQSWFILQGPGMGNLAFGLVVYVLGARMAAHGLRWVWKSYAVYFATRRAQKYGYGAVDRVRRMLAQMMVENKFASTTYLAPEDMMHTHSKQGFARRLKWFLPAFGLWLVWSEIDSRYFTLVDSGGIVTSDFLELTPAVYHFNEVEKVEIACGDWDPVFGDVAYRMIMTDGYEADVMRAAAVLENPEAFLAVDSLLRRNKTPFEAAPYLTSNSEGKAPDYRRACLEGLTGALNAQYPGLVHQLMHMDELTAN